MGLLILYQVPTDMQRMFVSYFQSLFTRDPTLNHTAITSLVQEKNSEEMNNDLCHDFSDEEISDSLFQIGPLKAPGLMVFRLDFIRGIGVWLNLKL
jgi:hypothetical protein